MMPVITSFTVIFARERAGGPSDRQVGNLQDRRRNQGFGLWASIGRRITIKRVEGIRNDFFQPLRSGLPLLPEFSDQPAGRGDRGGYYLEKEV